MKLVIGGATGYVGARTLQQALALDAITSVVTISRRPVPVPDEQDRKKLQEIILEDFLQYPDSAKRMLADADACVWTVALTPFKAVTRPWEEIKRVSADYALAAFKTMVEARTADKKLRFIYYSGFGTVRDQNRTAFVPLPGYARMRGQAENDLLKGAADSNGRVEVCVAKPAMVLAPNLPGRSLMDAMSKAVWFPTITIEDCVAATLKQCLEGIEKETLENVDLQRIGAAYLAKTKTASSSE